jgi:Protein of unknown function (DUF3383)
MSTIALPLSSVVDVSVYISPIAPSPPQFNQGLIIGNSTVIPSWGGPNPRARQYSSTKDMIADGFTTSSPEYLAASLYFGQTESPIYVWIGRQDITGTAIKTVVPNSISPGSGYGAGDILSVSGGMGGTCQVVVVDDTGVVQLLILLNNGTGYADGTNPTTGGTGTGCEVDITTGPESLAQAAEYCRSVSALWYGLYACGADSADILALSQFAQSAAPLAMHFYNTADADVPTTLTTDIVSQLKAEQFSRTIGVYSTDQGGTVPNNVYAGAALMGIGLGLNTQLANSYFTLKFKSLTGIAYEPLNPTQVSNILGKNGNFVGNYANAYIFIANGTLADGAFFDEQINIDVLLANIQYSVMDLLAANPSIPQTDAGQTQLIHTVNVAVEQALQVGFIAPGVWEGVQVLNLVPGTALPKGYLTQSPPYASQSLVDKQARKAMPIYVAVIEAGAVHSVVIGVYVQR